MSKTTDTSQRQGGASGARTALIGIILVAVNLRAATAGVGSTLPSIMSETGWSSALASGLVVLPLLAFAIVSPSAPALARRIGLDSAVGVGLGVLSVGILVRSLPGPIWIWVGTLGLGAGIAILNVLTPALVKRDFPHRIGGITATYTALQGGAAAIAVGIVAVFFLFDDGSWRQALASTALFALVACVYWAVRAASSSGARRADAAPAAPRVRSRGVNPWRQPLAWHLAVFMGMQSTVYYVLITWLPFMEQENGISAASASLHQMILQAASLLSAALGAALLGKGGDQRIIVVFSTAMMAAGVLGTLSIPEFAVAWALLIGTAAGLTLLTGLSLFGLRTRTSEQTQAVSSMGQTLGYLVAALAPVLLGQLRDISGSWTGPLLVLLALLIVQLVAGVKAAGRRFVW